MHALADFLAEALARDALHLALAACEVLRLAYIVAVGVAEAHALERVALRQAVLLLHDHPGRCRLCDCKPHTRTPDIYSFHNIRLLAKLLTHQELINDELLDHLSRRRGEV